MAHKKAMSTRLRRTDTFRKAEVDEEIREKETRLQGLKDSGSRRACSDGVRPKASR